MIIKNFLAINKWRDKLLLNLHKDEIAIIGNGSLKEPPLFSSETYGLFIGSSHALYRKILKIIEEYEELK